MRQAALCPPSPAHPPRQARMVPSGAAMPDASGPRLTFAQLGLAPWLALGLEHTAADHSPGSPFGNSPSIPPGGWSALSSGMAGR